MPATTSVRCGERGSLSTSQTEPTAPALASQAPKTKVLILACAIAPAHIAHGSSVTTSVWSSNRQVFVAVLAALSATISACAVGSLSNSRRFSPVPITVPSGEITMAPTGTSLVASARFAISNAIPISLSKLLAKYSALRHFKKFSELLAESNARRNCIDLFIWEQLDIITNCFKFHCIHS